MEGTWRGTVVAYFKTVCQHTQTRHSVKLVTSHISHHCCQHLKINIPLPSFQFLFPSLYSWWNSVTQITSIRTWWQRETRVTSVCQRCQYSQRCKGLCAVILNAAICDQPCDIMSRLWFCPADSLSPKDFPHTYTHPFSYFNSLDFSSLYCPDILLSALFSNLPSCYQFKIHSHI
jgi:hypothetical protein